MALQREIRKFPEKLQNASNMKLRTETLDFSEHLKSISWFSNLGNTISNEDIIQARHSNEAFAHFVSPIFENLNIQMGNVSHDYRSIINPGYGKASAEVANARAEMLALEADSVYQVSIRDFPFVWHYSPCVMLKSHISGFLAEIEFEQYGKFSLKNRIFLPWYEKGHLPCGWFGDVEIEPDYDNWKLPKGSLVVW